MVLSDNAKEIAQKRYFWDNENEWENLVDRICRENIKNEQKDRDELYEEFFSIIEPMYFIPAGRILRNLGKLRPSTSNCNFLPIDDNIESIFKTLGYYGVISAYGGGSGINFSNLRPKGSSIVSRGGESTGMVSFIDMFNFCGSKLETGGQRRAAGIALCHVSHPEVIDFMLKSFIISPKLTDEILDEMYPEDIVELMKAVSKVRLPEGYLTDIKKKLS